MWRSVVRRAHIQILFAQLSQYEKQSIYFRLNEIKLKIEIHSKFIGQVATVQLI